MKNSNIAGATFH